MTRRTKRTAAAACGVIASWIMSAAPAAAQGKSWEGRGFISVDGGYQASSTDFASNATFKLPLDATEDASLDAAYKIKAGPIISIRGGARVWRNLALGVGVTRFSRTDTVGIKAQLPHPFFFRRLREVNGDASGFKREELGVHIEATWLIPLNNKFDISIFGGPSYIEVKQDFVRQLNYADSYPYDTATFGGAESASSKKSKVGFNVGADFGYLFTKSVGVGATVRFTRVSVKLQPALGPAQKVDAGGAQVGGGLRVRF